MRNASSSLTSIPEEANTSVRSAASVGLSTGREGGPIVPGGGGAGDCGIPFVFVPFTPSCWFCGSCKVPKLGEA